MKEEPSASIALVIDDNRQAANTLCSMLQLLGLKALPVYGSRSAMMRLNQFIPKIIFMDINMPGLNGFEVLAFLRRMPKMEAVPVVFITSDDQPETKSRALQSGALQLVTKPFTLDAIECVLKDAQLI